MFKRNQGHSPSRLDSLVGAGTRIDGDVTFSGGLRVDGEIKGNVCSAGDTGGTLVISEQARIEGEIHVSSLVINGTVIGPVFSSEFVELQTKARITGDIQYNRLEMHLGAIVQGRLVHQGGIGKAVELKLASSS